jgi:predicted DCC family thiol-disulfide oxidoreductase YuxK
MRRDWHSVPADDLPDRVILFDGVCVLCSRWVAFIIARDPAARYRFVAIQTPLGRRLAARFGIDAENPQTNVVVTGGRAHFWTRVVWLLPQRPRNFLYDLIAQNRYRLFGRRATCLVPTPDVRARFMSESFAEAARAEPA